MGLLQWIGLGSEIAKPIDAVSNFYTTDKARIEAETKLEEVIQCGMAATHWLDIRFLRRTLLYSATFDY